MLHHKKNILKICIFLTLTCLFWLRGVIFSDPDFGWHIRLGELVLNTGFPKSDPFSYSMPSYNYADHEWLTEVIMVKLYPLFGIAGLSLIFALVTAAALFILFPTALTIYESALFLFSGSILLLFSGIRIQPISWLLFSMVLLLTRKKISLQVLLLPLLFLFWANAHGGFILGLLLLSLVLVSRSLALKKIDLNYLLLILLCLLITLVNPFGVRLWQEIWTTASDSMLRWTITEWLPIFMIKGGIFLWIWLGFTFFLVIKSFNKLTFFEKASYIIFFILTISSSRNFPFYLLVSIPISLELSKNYLLEIRHKTSAIFYKKIVIFMTFLLLSISLASIWSVFESTDKSQPAYSYPVEALNYIKQNNLTGRIFAFYGWGGYLILQNPGQKVFIDGRMPSWKQNYLEGESSYAFKDYLKATLTDIDLSSFFQKYHISTVLWVNSSINNSKQNNPLLPLIMRTYGINVSRKTFLQRVADLGWKKIYEDGNSVIYEK